MNNGVESGDGWVEGRAAGYGHRYIPAERVEVGYGVDADGKSLFAFFRPSSQFSCDVQLFLQTVGYFLRLFDGVLCI